MIYGTRNYRVELGVLLEILCPRDIDQDVRESADGVRIAAEHHVGETDIVVSMTAS